MSFPIWLKRGKKVTAREQARIKREGETNGNKGPSGTEERRFCQHSKCTHRICHNISLMLGRDLRSYQGLGGWIKKGVFSKIHVLKLLYTNIF